LVYGGVSRGCVAAVARAVRALILTGEPDAYRGLPTVEI
jgi:hypothetical protein